LKPHSDAKRKDAAGEGGSGLHPECLVEIERPGKSLEGQSENQPKGETPKDSMPS